MIILNHRANACIKNIETWFNCNLLTVNISRTDFILFDSSSVKLSDINLSLNYNRVSNANACKYLGIFIDNNLN